MDFVFRKGTLIITFDEEEVAHSQTTRTLGYKKGGIITVAMNEDKTGNLISVIIDEIDDE